MVLYPYLPHVPPFSAIRSVRIPLCSGNVDPDVLGQHRKPLPASYSPAAQAHWQLRHRQLPDSHGPRILDVTSCRVSWGADIKCRKQLPTEASFCPWPCMMQFVSARRKAYTLARKGSLPINLYPRECSEP